MPRKKRGGSGAGGFGPEIELLFAPKFSGWVHDKKAREG
jgi:hypothetical protein